MWPQISCNLTRACLLRIPLRRYSPLRMTPSKEMLSLTPTPATWEWNDRLAQLQAHQGDFLFV